ncbi:MAG: carboxymuconolactone decarboxylase family protein [Pseudomonadales bacterium]
MTESRRDKGIEMYNTVYCGALPQPPEEGVDKFFDYMLENLFGTLWADSCLSIRDRRLFLLGAIAAQGEEMTFGLQISSALKREELTAAQVEELILFMTQYIGYPKASKLRMAIAKTLQEYKK